jgi:hypothetical protein
MPRLQTLLLSSLPLLALTASASSPKHDVHISYCKAEVTGTTWSAKVTYYKDDFMKALRAWRGSEIAGLPAAELKRLYAGYLESHFRLMSNNAVIPWKWIFKGEDGTSIWFELRAEPATRVGSATIEHTALFKEYGDQMNLMLLKASGKEYNFIFTSSKPSASVAF